MLDFDELDLAEERAGVSVQAVEKELSTATPCLPGWYRSFCFECIPNFRDVAGPDPLSAPLSCPHGRLRRGLLFRSGQLTCASAADIARLRDDLGIVTYIDVRTGRDYEAIDGVVYDTFPPSPSGWHRTLTEQGPGKRRRVHCPFSKGLAMATMPKEEPDPRDRRACCVHWYQKQLRQVSDPVQLLTINTRAMLFINADEILKALRILTDPANYPCVFGCMAGKDRTGLLALLVLGALGFDERAIVEDYLATNASAAHIAGCTKLSMAQWALELQQHDPKQYERRRRQGVLPEAGAMSDPGPWPWTEFITPADLGWESMVYEQVVRSTLQTLQEECGGVRGYLASIGFDQSEIAMLQRILIAEEH